MVKWTLASDDSEPIPLNKDRFCQLWNRGVGADRADHGEADAVFEELAAHYREPHRHYHCGDHIDECLSRMDLAAAELGHSDSVELAVWFHDVIYLSGRADNEARSAEWFAEKAAGRFSPKRIRQVEGYILSTTHRTPPPDEGSKFVVDVDLSGLGMAPHLFRRDGDNIRKEFPHLSDAEFIRGQSGFLQKLLERERIYSTSFFHDLCEAPARRNIRAALKRYAKCVGG